MRRSILIATAAVVGMVAAACGSSTGDASGAGSSDAGSQSSSQSSAADTTSADAGSGDNAKAGGAGGDVGVFTWWADGSEKKGLDALEKLFGEQFPNDKFVNLAVAGGAGSNAKAKLAADLQAGNPPDSFQGHAGAELTDYINNGQIEPVDDLYKAEGWNDVFPADLLARLTVDNHIYSVPSNIHRANVVWVNNKLLTDNGIDPKKAPADIDAWIKDMDTLKAAGVKTPLSIAGTWTQVELLETVLISDLGVDGYNGLFDGKTGWDSDGVTKALNHYKTLLSYANTAADGDDWPGATDMVIDGTAAYNVMGDWAVAEFTDKGKVDGTDYSYWAVPGQDGVYDFLADSFTLPKGAPNAEGAKDWLRLIGSADGQHAFNLAKGSIPARTDIKPDDFPPYQQWAMGEFQKDQIVSSIAHGAAVNLSWGTDISNAVSQFYGSQDVAALQSALVTAAQSNIK
jgi:glucose/mannose transport system substrate-binding protein